MSKYYKPKLKECRTIYLRPKSQLHDILRVMAVSGEIGTSTFPLFGVGGKDGKRVKAGEIKRHILDVAEYKSAHHDFMFKGVAFNQRGQGNEKSIRISKTAVQLFDLVRGGANFRETYEGVNMPSDREHVPRNIALGDWCVFCLRAGIEFSPKFNPTLYELSRYVAGASEYGAIGMSEAESRKVSGPMFYSSREQKRRDGAAAKSYVGSRAIGCLVKEKELYVCYSIPKTRMVWHERSEQQLEYYMSNVFGVRNFGIRYAVGEKCDAVCMSESYESGARVIFSQPFVHCAKDKGHERRTPVEEQPRFEEMYRNVYLFPKNEDGVKQFIFFSIPSVHDKLIDVYVKDKRMASAEVRRRTRYDCDSYDEKSRESTLFFFDGCITRLKRCASQAQQSLFGKTDGKAHLKVVCFPWQKSFVRKMFGGALVEIKVEDYDEVYKAVTAY